MTDKELLELAAKAAGVRYSPEHSDKWGLWRVYDEEPGTSTPCYWNPLTKDGDALRLAVRVGLMVYVMNEANFTAIRLPGQHIGGKYDEVEQHGDDPGAATRRAIVRAAAEVGKAMP